MISLIQAWWNAVRKPHQCPQCSLRCKSVQGLGRHKAAHERKAAVSAEREYDKTMANMLDGLRGKCQEPVFDRIMKSMQPCMRNLPCVEHKEKAS